MNIDDMIMDNMMNTKDEYDDNIIQMNMTIYEYDELIIIMKMIQMNMDIIDNILQMNTIQMYL